MNGQCFNSIAGLRHTPYQAFWFEESWQAHMARLQLINTTARNDCNRDFLFPVLAGPQAKQLRSFAAEDLAVTSGLVAAVGQCLPCAGFRNSAM
jgi:hypothetical protein